MPAIDSAARSEEVTADELLAAIERRHRLAPGHLRSFFDGVPTDFPVSFRDRLPFAAHRTGAVGITLFGRVYLLRATGALPTFRFLQLLRHEAEHVAQQRRDGLRFYGRYLTDWLFGFLRASGGIRKRHAVAYRGIGYEREARRSEALVGPSATEVE